MLVGRFHVETVAERLEMADMVGSKFFKACILLHCVFKSRYIHTCIKQKCIIKCINNCVYIYFYVFNAERTSRVKIKKVQCLDYIHSHLVEVQATEVRSFLGASETKAYARLVERRPALLRDILEAR